MMASMILNTVFYNSIKNNTEKIEAYCHEIQYLYLYEKLKLPYYADYSGWEISLTAENETKGIVRFKAVKTETGQIYTESWNGN
jgi:hypothetical protein